MDAEQANNAGYQTRTFATELGRVTVLGHCLASDETILQTAYAAQRSENEAMLTHMPGSYATIIERQHQTTILSDLAGQFPIYYGQTDTHALFSTSNQTVGKQLGGLPNKAGLVSYLLSEASPLGWNPAVYEGVSRLPGAHRLDLTSQGISTTPYDTLAPEQSIDRAEAIEQIRSSLIEAIQQRAETGAPISADFSGGYDSTSLAFLAAAMTRAGDHVDVYHARYHDAPTSSDARYAKEYAALSDRLRLHMVDVPPAPIVSGESSAVQDALFDFISQRSNGRHLHVSGTAGDALFHTEGMHVVDMWRDKKLRSMPRFARDVLTQATLGNVDPRKVFGRVAEMAGYSYDDALDAIGDGLRGGMQQNPWVLLDGSALPLLGEAGQQALQQIIDSRRQVQPDTRLSVSDFRAITDIQLSGKIAAHDRQNAARHGLDLHVPYLDHNVIRATLRLPAANRYNARRFKVVLAEALDGAVPPEVFARNTKGTTASEAYADVRNNNAELRTLLGPESFLARLGVIDISAVNAGITKAELGAQKAPLQFLTKAVGIERWLRNTYELPKQQPQSKSPTHRPLAQESNIGSVFVPPYVRVVQDEAGLVLYNLQTKKLRSMHEAAASIFSDMQTDRAQQTPLAKEVVDNLLEQGFLEQGAARPFSPSNHPAVGENGFESLVNLGSIDTTDVRFTDYLRMAQALRQARTILENNTLWGATQLVADSKKNLNEGSEERAHRLLVAGHVLGRYALMRVACQELSLAVVLAEAKKGRAVDWAIGTAPDPRRVHAWPQVNGNPIHTAYDEMTQGSFTPFGVW